LLICPDYRYLPVGCGIWIAWYFSNPITASGQPQMTMRARIRLNSLLRLCGLLRSR
jgi:hypothetical protein